MPLIPIEQPEETKEPNIINPWESAQERIGIRDWVCLSRPSANEAQVLAMTHNDPEEMGIIAQMQETLRRIRDDIKIPLFFDLNDETDYSVHSIDFNGKPIVTRIAEVVTMNGIRYHLLPGMNNVPQIIYDYLMTIPDMRKHMAPIPNVANLLGTFSGTPGYGLNS
jgi:hypothetical protein